MPWSKAYIDPRRPTMTDNSAGDLGRPEAIAETPRIDSVAGEFISETLPDFDGGRQVTVYVPPSPPEAVVFAADGQGFSKWGRFLQTADVPPTMIVGVHGLVDEMPRLHEYSPAFDPTRFA